MINFCKRNSVSNLRQSRGYRKLAVKIRRGAYVPHLIARDYESRLINEIH